MFCTILSDQSEKNWECKNEHETPYMILKNSMMEVIWTLYQQGYTDFLVNCEQGIPLWAAEIISALKMYNPIHLHIVIPFEEQSTNWSEDWRDRYFAVHEKADKVTIFSNRYYAECYSDAEKFMIDQSDRLIVFSTTLDDLQATDYAMDKGVLIQHIAI